MKEFIHLFTPVSEGLPEINQPVYCIQNYTLFGMNDTRGMQGAYEGTMGDGRRQWRILYADGWKYEYEGITHWLDLSKLTTKEKGKEAIKNYTYKTYSDEFQVTFPDRVKEEISTAVEEYIDKNNNLL